jgi:hypothetical protein
LIFSSYAFSFSIIEDLPFPGDRDADLPSEPLKLLPPDLFLLDPDFADFCLDFELKFNFYSA